MFIKYVLIPLRMDKKKDIEKHSSKHGARETTRRRFVIFCIIFCVDSIKGDAQKKIEEEKKTRKHLQHQKHQKKCWNWQNNSLCVLSFVSFEKLKYKRAHQGLAQSALGYVRDVDNLNKFPTWAESLELVADSLHNRWIPSGNWKLRI